MKTKIKPLNSRLSNSPKAITPSGLANLLKVISYIMLAVILYYAITGGAYIGEFGTTWSIVFFVVYAIMLFLYYVPFGIMKLLSTIITIGGSIFIGCVIIFGWFGGMQGVYGSTVVFLTGMVAAFIISANFMDSKGLIQLEKSYQVPETKKENVVSEPIESESQTVIVETKKEKTPASKYGEETVVVGKIKMDKIDLCLSKGGTWSIKKDMCIY